MKTSTLNKESWAWYVFSTKRSYLVLTLFALLSFVQIGHATDYYFSSSSGNDSRSSTEAQNSATPWKSIDKLNAISSLLKGGDRIFFKAGDVFYGTIKITKSGSASAPILFTSYGTGSKPVITSLVKVTNLVSIGSGRYEADLSAFNLTKVQVVTINDQIKEVGRFPNTGSSDGGYLRIANVNSSTSISTLNSNPYSGTSGDVVIRKNNWIIDRHAISNISGTTISFKANQSHYAPLKNYGYFLQNHASLVDLPGEWSYDPTTKKLTVNLSGFNMTTVNVSVATLDNLVTNNQYITNFSFSNLHFKGSNSNLLTISRSQNVKIENCSLDYAGENAISAFDITGFLIQNNQINYSLNSGIHISYGAPGAIIRGNTITNTFPFQGMAKSSDLAGIGIYLASDGDGSLIEKNNLINSGFNGIHFGGSYTKVINNFIDNFCLFKQDGGGIYTNSDGFRDRNNVGREITGNIILNGKGTKLGTLEEVDMAEGIYLDDNSAGIKVSKNTIAFMTGKSIYLHNANTLDISENLFYMAKSQVQFTHDFMGDPIRNVRVSQNQFSSIDKTHQIYSVYSKLDDIGSVGTFTTNYFLDPFKNDFFIHTKGSSDGSTGISRNLSNWTTNFGYDANSLKPDLTIPTFKITSSTLIKESNFSSNTSIIAGVYGATSQLVSSGISGGTLRMVPNSTNRATAYIQIGAIQTGQKIMVEFDMKGSPANIPVELFLEGTFNIDKGLSNGKASTTLTAKSNQIILTSLTARSNESVVFRFPPTVTELLLDNIKISRVTTEEINKESLIFFDYNPTGTAVQKPLDGTYVNAKNETFSGSVTVPSYGSVLLVKVSSTTTTTPNQAPTISLSKPTAGQVFINGVDPVELVANAQDPEGKIKQVEFYSGSTLLTTVTAPPYSYLWSNIQNGSYQVSAKVIDEGNLNATSSAVSFTVKAQEPAPNQAPTISLSKPTAGQVFINGVDPVELVANAQDPEGKIKQVEFYNGSTLLSTVTAPPYSYKWTNIQNGSYQVSAKVIDEGNLSASSSTVSFTVKAQETTSPAYTAQMVAPINNSTIELGSQTVVLKTNASTSGLTIQKVEFFNWGFPLVSVTSGNFEFTWSRIEVDNYSINAKVTDSKGNVYTTPAIRFSVKAPSSSSTTPVNLNINLSQPLNNQTFTLGQETVKLKADVGSSTTVKSIQFFNWGVPLVAVTSSPYEFNWTRIEVGSYQVYAVVTDIDGKTSTSNTVKFQVNPATTSSTTTSSSTYSASVVMSQPTNNQIFELGKTPVVLKATTSEAVSKVEFFNWYLPLVSVTGGKTEFSWTKIEVGEYFVSARITDSKGNVIDSAPVRFKVVSPNTRTTEEETENVDSSPINNASAEETLAEEKDSSVYGIKMGPNPTSSHLNIFLEDYPDNFEGQVSVFDLRGVELFQSNFNTDQETLSLDLSYLKPGIYVVKLNFGDKIFQTRKLIKN